MVREPPDVDRHRELRRGPRADAGHGEQLQPPPVRQVDRGLEGRAGLEQHRAQAVLVPGRAGDDVVALRREGAGGLEGLGAAGGEPGQVGDPEPRGAARLTARDPMLRNWSTTTSVPAGAEANSASSSASLLRTGALASTSPSRSIRQAQCDDLPTSRPSTAAGLVDGAFTVVSFR